MNTAVAQQYRGNSSEQLHVSHECENSFPKFVEVESQGTFIPQDLGENEAMKQSGGEKKPSRNKKAFGSRATWPPHSLRNGLPRSWQQ